MGDHPACLAHLGDAERDAYLTGLAPGADIDHRGTTFTEPLLDALLDALRDPATGSSRFGTVRFDAAVFQNDARFDAAVFEGDARFGSATFRSSAWFGSVSVEGAEVAPATFEGGVWFGSAVFEGAAWFGSAVFRADARFDAAVFEDEAGFGSAVFQGPTGFGSATFEEYAWFGSATFHGDARFDFATFRNESWFGSAVFRGDARFDAASFEYDTWFDAVTFGCAAGFGSATFEGVASFGAATFEGEAGFGAATFKGEAGFGAATFEGEAGFGAATFEGEAGFGAAVFRGDARFGQAVFERAATLGPLECAGRVVLSGAVFGSPVTLSFAARHLECRRTRWSSTAEVRLRYATADFAHAVFEYPLTVATEAGPFLLPDGQPVAEQALAGDLDATARIASLRGVDAAHLVLADVDLSECLFTGTVHLDQVRLEGDCPFDKVPPVHWRRWPPRFTQRRTLAEEHHWRARRPTAAQGWNMAVSGAGHTGPAQLAPVYRALRKAFEDGKNEPGAADFYYGEMEMRRHDRTGTTRAERGLLHGYWMLSGYGLRASRALGWLAVAMLVTIVLLMGFGLPEDSPKQEATGTVPPGGGLVAFEIGKADPQNPVGERFTGERFEKALNVTLDSVVFRSSGQDLTTAGTYIEMVSRVAEPVLLGLAVLAVRSRVKR
ncbi:pentapeptide repeat-containing protein [Streptomyces sp. NPDC044984]|uniref:pentapeptide repeat-containing protein n=1 Tax=Streptomyces sp. NPDC044984 TaxID=3154335 RepID=UPI0033F48FD8